MKPKKSPFVDLHSGKDKDDDANQKQRNEA